MLRRTLLVLLGLTLLRWPVAAAVNAMLPDVMTAPEVNYLAAMLQSLLMFALPGWLLKPGWHMPVLTGRERLGWGMVCVGAALVWRAVVTPLHAWWTDVLGLATTPIVMPGDWPVQLLAILAYAVIPAICEELFFRGALLPRLLQCASRMQALTLTTLLFALMHANPAGLPGHLLSSLLFSLLMLHSGRIIVPIAAHMVYNLSALYWPETGAFVPWVCGAAMLGFTVWLLIRQPKGQERRMDVGDGMLCAAAVTVLALQYLFAM